MNYKPGTRIAVKPVIFYPKGTSSSRTWVSRWKKFHEAARLKYSSMLKGRDTFELDAAISFKGELSAESYNNMCFSNDGLKYRDQLRRDDGCSAGVEAIIGELLLHHPQVKKYTRYTMPWCLSILMVDTDREWTGGGGRNLNGDLNLGAGILVIPTWQYDDGKLMSTLVHELGHAFGLVHCWQRPVDDRKLKSCYYGQFSSNSIMGYNSVNWSNSTDPAQIPGCLLGDEIDALSQNKLIFPKLYFDPDKDFDCPPSKASCAPHTKESHPLHLGPMHLVFCTTSNPSGYSSITTLNDKPGKWILGSHSGIGFDPQHMWHSGKANSEGWVSMDVTFPLQVTLDRVQVYTEYGGNTHKADMVQLERENATGNFVFVKRIASPLPDSTLNFAEKKARTWRFAFKAGNSGYVVVRGIRYFQGDNEIFPPLGPHAMTGSGETYKSKVTNLVEIQREIRANTPKVAFDPTSMWHSAKVNDKGWASLEVVFPTLVTLDKLVVYSQHSGKYHKVKRVQVEVAEATGKYKYVKRKTFSKATDSISFPKTSGKAWKFAFEGQPGGYVVIRGLRFLIGNEEFYPPSSIS